MGAIIGATLLLTTISMSKYKVADTGLGTNGYGKESLVGLNAGGALIVEIILTFVFVLTILAVTSDKMSAPFAGIVIGLTLTFVHILGIALTGTSVNPARSFGPALLMAFTGETTHLIQVWVFIIAPLIGAAAAAGLFAWFKPKKD